MEQELEALAGRRLPRRPSRHFPKGSLTMTTVTASVPARARDLLASEWLKLRSVRSTYLILLIAAAAAVGVRYLVTHSDATHWATMTASARAAFDPVSDSFTGLVLAAGFYLAVMAWVGLGLGAVIRHTAGAITATVGAVFLLPTIIHALPSPWDTRIGRLTLDGAAQQMIAQHPHPGYFSADPSFFIVAGYAAVAIAAAAFLITRRDA